MEIKLSLIFLCAITCKNVVSEKHSRQKRQSSFPEFVRTRVGEDFSFLEPRTDFVVTRPRGVEQRTSNRFSQSTHTAESSCGEADTGGLCDPGARYRTFSGRCNNLQHPHWGRSHSAYVRLLAPAYSDSSLAFRLSAGGSELPSARAVSDRLAGRGGGGRGGTDLSGHSMQWGQFLTHDLDHTPEQAPPHVTDCCGEDREHSACAPINIPAWDSLYSAHNKTCINFIRSSLATTSDCMVDQQNQVTNYIDGSMVYGSDQETMLSLRELEGGRLRTSGGKFSWRGQ